MPAELRWHLAGLRVCSHVQRRVRRLGGVLDEECAAVDLIVERLASVVSDVRGAAGVLRDTAYLRVLAVPLLGERP